MCNRCVKKRVLFSQSAAVVVPTVGPGGDASNPTRPISDEVATPTIYFGVSTDDDGVIGLVNNPAIDALTSNSEVFQAMFSTDSYLEYLTKRVTIEDTEPHAFACFVSLLMCHERLSNIAEVRVCVCASSSDTA